jgi:NADH:ubiquinone oxidoreductase subunit F (NADH-binding)
MRRSAASLGEPAEECARISCLGYCARAPVVRRAGRYFEQSSAGLEEIVESTPGFVAAHLEHIAAYQDRGGYSALEQYLVAPDPEGLIRKIERASLRGMGGAGFPAHVKWEAVRSSADRSRVLLVNAHEGEPATFKDREILERDPHRLIEGALLAALGVGAGRVLIGLKSEYENAGCSLEEALDEFETRSELSWPEGTLPPIEIHAVPGPYVTGEETALMEALEGRRSEPRLRPPFPAEFGLNGRPTLVQNVETLAALPHLLRAGTNLSSSGSVEKVYCLTGDVTRPGAYRHPLGMRAAELIEQDGGSVRETLKAFLPGGLSGGLLPASKLDLPLDFESVRREGGGLGTGAIIAIGRDRCIVDVLENISSFFATESCGKCVPCRLGTAKLQQLLRALRAGRASEPELEEGLAVAQLLQETSICALGQVAGKALMDAMKHFPGEIHAHTRGECPALHRGEALPP